MATFNRPTLVPTWCADNQTNVAQPTDTLRAVGYVANEPPLAENFNWLFWMLGNWVGYLDQANAATVMSTTLDVNTRLVGGGQWSYNATTSVLSWSSTASLSIPSIALADNAIAAGSVTLGNNVVAYVQANVPFTTSGGITSGDAHVTSISYPAAIAVGQAVTGTGIPANTTVTAINDSTLTLSNAVTVTNATATLTFAGTGALTVQAAAAASFLPNPNTVILAVGQDAMVYVGANSGQMVLRNGESKSLLGTSGYSSTFTGPAGAALALNTPVYVSVGSNDSRTKGALYPCDTSAANGATRGQFIGFAINAFAANATAHVATAGIVNGFSGLTVGAVHYLDPVNVGGITATRPTSSGQFIVPVGFSITPTSLRINPDATRSLVAINPNVEITGNLQVDQNTTLLGPLTANASAVFGGNAQVSGTLTASGASNFNGAASFYNTAVNLAAGATFGTDINTLHAINSTSTITGNSVVSSVGFKSTVQAGMWFAPSYAANSSPNLNLTNAPQIAPDGTIGQMIWQWVMDRTGSLLGISCISNSSTNNSSDVAYCGAYLNGFQTIVAVSLYAKAPTYAYTSIAPGNYKFNPGDIITVKIQVKNNVSPGTGSYMFLPFVTVSYNA